MDDSNKLTVSTLAKTFNALVEDGYGDFEIRVENEERPLYDDELLYNYTKREIVIQRYKFHDDFTKKVNTFNSDLQKAIDKFYRFKE